MAKLFRAGRLHPLQGSLFAVGSQMEVQEEPAVPARKPVGSAALSTPPLRIAVEGPIRVGKSALMRLLAERMGAAMLADSENNPFLQRFYAGEPGMAFAAQTWFLHERAGQMRAALELSGPVVSDYMYEKDKLFAFLNLSDAELAIYNEMYAAETLAWRPDLVVYLKASPGTLMERLNCKAFPPERGVSREYMAQVCDAYDHFFARYTASRLLVVDTSAIDFVHSAGEREALLDRVLQPVHGCEHYAPLARTA